MRVKERKIEQLDQFLIVGVEIVRFVNLYRKQLSSQRAEACMGTTEK